MKKLLVISIILGLCLTLGTVSFLFLNPRAASAAEEVAAPPASKLININTASAGELTNLKGIGEKTAQAIVEYRQKNGAFKAIEDIKNVKGIGDKKFEVFKSSICVK